jgi:putative membrane protein
MSEDLPKTLPPPTNSSFELASRNTDLALQRTRMAADRTLMAVLRTALSLISFGFTIFNVVKDLQKQNILKDNVSIPHFGAGLVLLGVLMLAIGIIFHLQFMYSLRKERKRLILVGLIHTESSFPPSLTLMVAVILLGFGLAVIMRMFFQYGPL